MTREEFIAAVIALKDVPFLHKGRTAESGVDCVGLTALAAINAGSTVVDVQDYPRRPTGTSLIDGLKKNAKMVFGDPQPGDLLVFAFGRDPAHVAVYIGDGRLVHSHSGAGKVVEHDFEISWQRRHVATMRPFFDEVAT